MSLINKMLQDLDARGTPAGESFPSNVKPVAPARRGLNKRAIVVAVAGACAVGALAWYGWGQFRGADGGQAAAPVAAVVASKPAAAPGMVAPGQGMTSTITLAPNDAASPVPKLAPPQAVTPGGSADAVPAGATAAAAAGADTVTPAGGKSAAMVAPPAQPAPSAQPQPRAETTRPSARRSEAAPPARSYAPVEPDSEAARAMRNAMLLELQSRQARPAAHERHTEGGRSAGREETGKQRAEGEYRRALASLQEGRMIETVASLEQALRIDPLHEAARQTLVGLLIEAKRPDDAMRQLQLGLTQDPRQPALAMLLARLQIERGGSGIETLTRTLPYAGNNPEYHAFLAGALQRQQRHREAALEYQSALRGTPDNGVWWMGLGISLQAEKRNGEALDAFQKAKAGAGLTPELQAFVERKIQQLGH